VTFGRKEALDPAKLMYLDDKPKKKKA